MRYVIMSKRIYTRYKCKLESFVLDSSVV
jgi:hypothetical protein